jgi:hypothetical protein
MVLFHPITLAHVALISSKNCHLLSWYTCLFNFIPIY